MIEMYTGFVGSGKSYHATFEGVRVADSSSNKYVIANFPIFPKKKFLAKIPYIKNKIKNKYVDSRWIYKKNEELTVDFLIKASHKYDFYGNEGRCLLIFDEAGIMFNSRDWNIKPDERKKWIKFFSQSRKFGYDIIFIAQDSRMIDRQIRALVEYEVQHKKLNNWFIFKLLPFTAFGAVKFWNGIRNFRGSLQIILFRKKIAERYDTMGLFDYEKKLTEKI